LMKIIKHRMRGNKYYLVKYTGYANDIIYIHPIRFGIGDGVQDYWDWQEASRNG
ncbi:hypothetical protein GGI03_008393, partial [Coemansia sp. RSA 2337]